MAAPPIIAARLVSKQFQDRAGKPLAVLQHVDLEVFEAEFLVILGPSGSGKSTLLRILSGLEPSYAGSVALAPGVGRGDFAFVFQHFALLPWLTVSDNIGLGLFARRADPQRLRAVIARELRLFGLEKFARAFPGELSGGMRQRAGIARALATDPRIIFMDEPFSELDSFTAQTLRADLLDIWRERRMTIVMVSHQIDESLELADRIAVLTPRPGRIERLIDNRLPRPRDSRSPAFYQLHDAVYQVLKP